MRSASATTTGRPVVIAAAVLYCPCSQASRNCWTVGSADGERPPLRPKLMTPTMTTATPILAIVARGSPATLLPPTCPSPFPAGLDDPGPPAPAAPLAGVSCGGPGFGSGRGAR